MRGADPISTDSNTWQQQLIGKAFLHPVLDSLLLGGAWSIAATALLLARPSLIASLSASTLALVILLANSAHFAASTVRLYSKPSYYREFPFLIAAVPIVAFAVLSASLITVGGIMFQPNTSSSR